MIRLSGTPLIEERAAIGLALRVGDAAGFGLDVEDGFARGVGVGDDILGVGVATITISTITDGVTGSVAGTAALEWMSQGVRRRATMRPIAGTMSFNDMDV